MSDPFAGLKVRFLARAADDLEAMRAGDDLHRRVHQLAGAAGTFGYPDLGHLASVVDLQLADGAADPDDLAALLAALAAIIPPAG